MNGTFESTANLERRLVAIEAVARVYPGTRVIEHLLVSLVRFLRATISRPEVVSALTTFLTHEPARAGAVETLEYVSRSTQWPELYTAVAELASLEGADFRNRDLARVALKAFDPERRLSTYRSLRAAEILDEVSPMIADGDLSTSPSWEPMDQLAERLLAIEAVLHVLPDRAAEHLLVDLTSFLESSGLGRHEVVDVLIEFLSAVPPRIGAVEALTSVNLTLGWPELHEALEALSVSTTAHRWSRALAREVLGLPPKIGIGEAW